jgi:hypothetical protein
MVLGSFAASVLALYKLQMVAQFLAPQLEAMVVQLTALKHTVQGLF